MVQGTSSLEFLFSSLTPKFGSYLEFSSTPVASGYPVHCILWTRLPARTDQVIPLQRDQDLRLPDVHGAGYPL